jgi:hypothetical protein
MASRGPAGNRPRSRSGLYAEALLLTSSHSDRSPGSESDISDSGGHCPDQYCSPCCRTRKWPNTSKWSTMHRWSNICKWSKEPRPSRPPSAVPRRAAENVAPPPPGLPRGPGGAVTPAQYGRVGGSGAVRVLPSPDRGPGGAWQDRRQGGRWTRFRLSHCLRLGVPSDGERIRVGDGSSVSELKIAARDSENPRQTARACLCRPKGLQVGRSPRLGLGPRTPYLSALVGAAHRARPPAPVTVSRAGVRPGTPRHPDPSRSIPWHGPMIFRMHLSIAKRYCFAK